MEDPRSLILSEHVAQIASPTSGWVRGVDARWIGETSMRLGAGRSQVGAPIDPRVGIALHKKLGDHVSKGEALADLFYEASQVPKELASQVRDAFHIGKKKAKPGSLIKGILKNY